MRPLHGNITSVAGGKFRVWHTTRKPRAKRQTRTYLGTFSNEALARTALEEFHKRSNADTVVIESPSSVSRTARAGLNRGSEKEAVSVQTDASGGSAVGTGGLLTGSPNQSRSPNRSGSMTVSGGLTSGLTSGTTVGTAAGTAAGLSQHLQAPNGPSAGQAVCQPAVSPAPPNFQWLVGGISTFIDATAQQLQLDLIQRNVIHRNANWLFNHVTGHLQHHDNALAAQNQQLQLALLEAQKRCQELEKASQIQVNAERERGRVERERVKAECNAKIKTDRERADAKIKTDRERADAKIKTDREKVKAECDAKLSEQQNQLNELQRNRRYAEAFIDFSAACAVAYGRDESFESVIGTMLKQRST